MAPQPLTTKLMETRMDTQLYPVVAEWDAEVRAWSLLSPDFPEVASVAIRRDEVAEQATDAVWTALQMRHEDGEAIPAPTLDPSALTAEWRYPTENFLLFVPVPVEPPPAEAVRVNISIDRRLLERIDTEARRLGMTRSGLLAQSVKVRLRG